MPGAQSFLAVSLVERASYCRRPVVRPMARTRGSNGSAARAGARKRALEDVAAAIAACIEQVSAARMHETAAMLSIARLDLLVRLHGVSEQELEDLNAIRNGAP
jgi:hypothetical protein